MKVIFFIYSQGNASGGHYHSLDQLSKEIGLVLPVGIISIGTTESPVLRTNPFYKRHIYFQGNLNGLPALDRVLRIEIGTKAVSVLHCFDTESMNWLLLTPCTRKIPIVLNKCGGPNPIRRRWQYADDIVLFSKENYNWFRGNPKYRKARLHLIPNRVHQLQLNGTNTQMERINVHTVNFVRISRLGGAYEKTLWDTLRLIGDLREEFSVHLYIIGRIQDPIRFAAFEEHIEKERLPVTIITDERASRGADFLYLADFVIGTGRSLMEALSLGIPTLTPVANMDWPVLVLGDNFDSLFETNFSERNIADSKSIEENRSRLIRLLNDPSAYQASRREAKSLFDQYFNISGVSRKYEAVYQNAVVEKRNRMKLILSNLKYILKFALNK